MPEVVVTGGSRGLGLAIVRRLALAGHTVTAIARRSSDALADSIEASGGAIRFVPFDLADIDGIAVLVRGLHAERPIGGLVNNAAIGTSGALALMPNAQVEALIRLNTLAPIVLTKYVVRQMLAAGGGRIVNVASIVGFTGYSGLSVYAATKASMLGFTRSLAREVGRAGINVNAIAPGFLDTEMTGDLKDERREQVMRRSALKRMAETGDVAAAVEFLLGPGAKSITGTVLTVDAGSTA